MMLNKIADYICDMSDGQLVVCLIVIVMSLASLSQYVEALPAGTIMSILAAQQAQITSLFK